MTEEDDEDVTGEAMLDTIEAVLTTELETSVLLAAYELV